MDAKTLALYLGCEAVVNMKYYLLGATGKGVDLLSVRASFDSISRRDTQQFGLSFKGEEGLVYYNSFDERCRLWSHFVKMEHFKLLLRPLSSMNDEEKIELSKVLGGAEHLSNESIIAQVTDLLKRWNTGVTNISAAKWFSAFEWMRSKYFDVTNSIEKGEALDATKP